MNRKLIALIAFSVLCQLWLGAQTAPGPDATFQILGNGGWTDTGLELKTGDVLQISATAANSSIDTTSGGPACDPMGVRNLSQADLPLPAAAPGTLIARLHAQGATPLLIGPSSELHIEEPSHLFLGMNLPPGSACQGAISVKVYRAAAGATSTIAVSKEQSLVSDSAAAKSQSASPTSASPSAGETPGEKTRGEQLKSQLSTAAQIFMSGQFGVGKSESGSTANATSTGGGSGTESSSGAATLKISEATLDSGLKAKLDSLPRRVNDQFQNLGDMINFVIIGSQKDVQAALDAATWHVADTSNEKAVLGAVLATYQNKDYLQMPMSALFLFGRKQDFGYEMAEPIAMVASRHHFRIWKAPFSWQGQEVWVGAGTHDIAFAKDKRNGSVTHKIDPAVDGERDNIGASLQKDSKTKLLTYYLPSNPVQEAKNATGDGYHSDGRLLVIFLQ